MSPVSEVVPRRKVRNFKDEGGCFKKVLGIREEMFKGKTGPFVMLGEGSAS